jgi:hypothetical protein
MKVHERMHTTEGIQGRKRAEQRVASLLDGAGLEYKREHTVGFACVTGESGRSYARVDFVLLSGGQVTFLEVDEGQHKFGDFSVSCDMARMGRIVESLAIEGNTLPVLFVRYNPDAYRVAGA